MENSRNIFRIKGISENITAFRVIFLNFKIHLPFKQRASCRHIFDFLMLLPTAMWYERNNLVIFKMASCIFPTVSASFKTKEGVQNIRIYRNSMLEKVDGGYFLRHLFCTTFACLARCEMCCCPLTYGNSTLI